MEKIFKVSQVRDLLNQVFRDKITFSRFVEILNEHANANGSIETDFSKTDLSEKEWFKWISESEYNGLNETQITEAIKDISKKINEIVSFL